MAWFWQRKKEEQEKKTAASQSQAQKQTLRDKVGSKATDKKVTKTATKKSEGAAATGHRLDLINRVLLGPVVTEKAARLAEEGTYVFEVARDANKLMIAEAIAAQYHVHPIKVTVVNAKGQSTFFAQRHGTRGSLRKAYVSLKAGESIELFERS